MQKETAARFTTEDVTYRASPAGPLLARLYQPAGKGPFPAVVSVHGGRWCAETRLTNAPIDEALAAAGILVMAIDFRMPPEARYPLPVDDINCAIRWLKRYAAERSIPSNWIGGLGASSGGHQILLNALQPDNPDYSTDAKRDEPAHGAALAFVVACWPVADPLARYRYALEKNMELHVKSHDAYWTDEAAMAEGSPQRIVAEGRAQDLPPTLIVQGGADIVLTPDMSDRFAQTYAEAGGEVALRKFAGEGHTFIIKNPASAASGEALSAIIDFINARCGLGRAM